MISRWSALIRVAMVVMVAILCHSCSTQMYSGERLEKDQVVRLKESSDGLNSAYFVTLWEVNGRRVHDASFGIDVPPGRTRMTVLVHSPPTARNSVGYRRVSRTITTKAGYEYLLSSDRGRLVVREELNQNLIDKLKKPAAADGS